MMLQSIKHMFNLQEKPQMKVIAHRGLCSVFPENTMEAVISAFYCSDLVELDVQLTKDEQIVVFHDRGLKRVTDVSERYEFRDRMKTLTIDDYNEEKSDWWIRDFTLEQLKSLKVRQPRSNRPQLHSLNFKISTLEEIILESLRLKQTKEMKRNKSGLLIQIKGEIFGASTPRDQIISEKLCQLLIKHEVYSAQACLLKNLPIVVQSFQLQLLKNISTQNPIVQLYDSDIVLTQQHLRKTSNNVMGIGITHEHMNPSLTEMCKKLDYQIFYWTIRDDESHIPLKENSHNDAYKKLKSLGVTGFITQFPDKCKGALGLEY